MELDAQHRAIVQALRDLEQLLTDRQYDGALIACRRLRTLLAQHMECSNRGSKAVLIYIPPGSTVHAPSGQVMKLRDASRQYQNAGYNVVVVAGERYGMGSSRDWAAKGVALLGVRAVLALSFERIHRSNLIGMGILPLRLPAQFGPDRLQLRPGDVVNIHADVGRIVPRGQCSVTIRGASGSTLCFEASMGIETSVEIENLKAGGIIPLILNRLLATDCKSRSSNNSPAQCGRTGTA